GQSISTASSRNVTHPTVADPKRCEEQRTWTSGASLFGRRAPEGPGASPALAVVTTISRYAPKEHLSITIAILPGCPACCSVERATLFSPSAADIVRDDYLPAFGVYPLHTHSMACGRNCCWALPTLWRAPRHNRYWYS